MGDRENSRATANGSTITVFDGGKPVPETGDSERNELKADGGEEKGDQESESGVDGGKKTETQASGPGEGLKTLSYEQELKLAAELDGEDKALDCWVQVAEILLDDTTIARIDYGRDTGRATDHFFFKLSQSHIFLTLEQFSNAAKELGRLDIVELISKIIEEKMNTKLSELEIIEERKKIKLSELDALKRRKILHLVSHCYGNPDGGWLGFAHQLGLSDDAISSCFAAGRRADRNYSPTREMLKVIMARYTTDALSKLTEALEKLRRKDLLKIIKKRPEQSHSC